MAALWSSVVSA